MADGITATYSFTQPEVGASNATWGGKLNTNWATLDALLDGTNPITPDLGTLTINGVEVTTTAAVLNLLDSQNLSGGFIQTNYDAGIQSSGTFTPDPLQGNSQRATNNGAHAIAPFAQSTNVSIEYTNGASAGAVDISAFDIQKGAFTDNPGDVFLVNIQVCNSTSIIVVDAV